MLCPRCRAPLQGAWYRLNDGAIRCCAQCAAEQPCTCGGAILVYPASSDTRPPTLRPIP